jgi:hypothetical protein
LHGKTYLNECANARWYFTAQDITIHDIQTVKQQTDEEDCGWIEEQKHLILDFIVMGMLNIDD